MYFRGSLLSIESAHERSIRRGGRGRRDVCHTQAGDTPKPHAFYIGRSAGGSTGSGGMDRCRSRSRRSRSRRSRSRRQRGRPRRGRSRRRPCRSRRPSASVAIAEATVVATMAITHTAPTTRPIRRHARLPAASPSPPRRAPRPITTPSTTGRSRVAPTPHRTARRIGSRCMLPLFVPRSGRPRRRIPRLSSGAQGRVKKASAAVPAARGIHAEPTADSARRLPHLA